MSDALTEAIARVPDDEVEAAAKAMYERVFNKRSDASWESCGPHWREGYRSDAAVAIAAASLVNDRVFSNSNPMTDRAPSGGRERKAKNERRFNH